MIAHPSLLVTRYSLRNALVILFSLVAFFLRTYQLAGLGLGLEHDEVAEWLIADGIRHGESALFFKEAYGQEPLFLYLMAGSTALIGDNTIGVRFTSVFIAMLTLAASYRLLRRMFSPLVAIIALAGMSIALWPVFWGRVALRAMTLPLMMCFAFDGLWQGFTTDNQRSAVSNQHLAFSIQRLQPFIFAGIFFGLSAYTYLSSRALPILLLLFTVYLALFARDRMRGKWRGLFASYLIGVVIALPLVITVLANPDLQFRVSEVSSPLDKALQGDTREVMDNIPRAFGMFTMKGDNTVRDNWPDRPVFPEPLGQLLFTLGFFIALTRFTQPRYALAIMWIGAMLIPTIVTTGAPNFTRTLGALPMVFAMPGIAIEWLSIWPLRMVAIQYARSIGRVLMPIGVIALLVVFGINTTSTYQDYFVNWPNHPETQFVFQSDFAAVAKDIDVSEVMDVSVGGLSNDTMDDPSLYLLRQRKDVRVRWFDSGSPNSSGGAIIEWFTSGPVTYLPSIVPVSPLLESQLRDERCIKSFVTDQFRRYQSRCGGTPGIGTLARWFEDTAIFIGASSDVTQTLRAGEIRQFVTTWRAHDPIVYPRRVFAHLINPQTGKIVAQHDGLDSPTKYWQPHDYIRQVHTLSIPADTPPGKYELWVGMYDPTNGKRVLQTDQRGTELPSDHILLGTIEIMR